MVHKTVWIIKPDWVSAIFDWKSFSTIFEEKLYKQKIEILDVFDIHLDELWLRRIFPILNIPSDFWEEWKQDFIKHMQTTKIKTYLLEGENACSVLAAIKKELRYTLLKNNQDYLYRVIKNLLHTADIEDLDETIKTVYEYKYKEWIMLK